MPNFLWRLVSILWHCRRGHRHGRRSITNSTSFLSPEDLSLTLAGSDLHVFTYAEMIAATKNFAPCNLVGSGGFGRVYKGVINDGLRPRLAAQTVAVKYLEPGGVQGQREWQTEVMFLGRLRHPNLVKLIGYCYEKEHRMIVYEFVAEGSLETHLFRKPLCDPLPWRTRLKIAVGAAKGLAFLHEAEKPVIYRDFKASNILLDPVLGSVSAEMAIKFAILMSIRSEFTSQDYTAKLSDFGLAKDGPEGDDTHISTSVMGTHGYVAPEYVLTGHLTAMSDVYSFGVVLLELLTGRQCFDGTRRCRERDLVCWAKRYLRRPKKKLYKIMDPRLQYYCQKDAEKAAMVACKCLSSNRKLRPRMRDVVEALEPLLESNYAPTGPAVGPVVTVEEDDEEGDEEKRDGEIIEIMSNGHKRASKFRYRCKQRFPSSAIHAETTTDFTSSVNHDQRCPGDQERGA